jgi:DNA gyrase/topoisomerase IV subunit A
MGMQGGKNHASARYIFTCLAPITRALFVQADDVLLDYLKEDGQSIEPTWFVIFPSTACAHSMVVFRISCRS